MTATLSDSRAQVLTSRLRDLEAERDQTLAELVPAGSGDDADRATNVDAHVRLSVLHERIASVEYELATLGSDREQGTGVRVGDVVTLDFGDGPETYLFASVDEAGGDLDVVTPASPLGRALEGASAGTEVSYAPRSGKTSTVKVVSIS